MDNPKERRKFVRVPFVKDIVINNNITVKSIDLSEGGLYVYTDRLFEVRSMLDVTIPLNGEKLTLKARIEHTQPSVGMGLKFIYSDDVQRDKIKNFIERKTAKEPQAEKEKKTVLLVEDNEMSRDISKNKLTLEGFHVVAVEDGIEAIKFLQAKTPDLIILDLFMEKLDGFKVLTIIRESPRWKDIPVIVFSVKGTQDVVEKVINAGADEFLVKMITSPKKLLETARNVLKRKNS